jgi:hypothetical protein
LAVKLAVKQTGLGAKGKRSGLLNRALLRNVLVGRVGIEPTTIGLKVRFRRAPQDDRLSLCRILPRNYASTTRQRSPLTDYLFHPEFHPGLEVRP